MTGYVDIHILGKLYMIMVVNFKKTFSYVKIWTLSLSLQL